MPRAGRGWPALSKASRRNQGLSCPLRVVSTEFRVVQVTPKHLPTNRTRRHPAASGVPGLTKIPHTRLQSQVEDQYMKEDHKPRELEKPCGRQLHAPWACLPQSPAIL